MTRRRADILQRQIERERAALARRAAQLDFAAEQIRKLAADREAEAGAAVFAAGAGIGLLEGLEDDALLLERNADAGVGDLERHDGGAWLSSGWSGDQPPTAAETLSRTPPCSVNLKAFDSRFFSTCCKRLESVVMVRQIGSISTSNELRLSASWRNGRAVASMRLVSRPPAHRP